MQAAVVTCSKFEYASPIRYSLVNLTSSGTNFLSSNLHICHGRVSTEYNSRLQGRVMGNSKYVYSMYILEIKSRGYHSVQCKVSNAQSDFSSIQKDLKEEEQKRWEACRELLLTLNFSIQEGDVILGKAFGWVQSPYWGEGKAKTVPNNDLVCSALNYIRSLGLSDVDLHKLLKKFPEVLGCSLDNDLMNNVATLERDWGIKGNTLRSLILRNPKVLGYNVDCKGDCMGQCTRCWVRF